MKYMLMILDSKTAWAKATPAEQTRIVRAHGGFGKKLKAKRKQVEGWRLRPEDDASRVGLSKGKAFVTDGPFAETKEFLGGFYLIDCATREEAVAWAKEIPILEGDVVEVRPVWG